MKKSLFKLFSVFIITVFIPTAVFAAIDISGGPCDSGLSSILCRLTILMSQILPVLITLGVIYFIWGIVNYVIADSEEAKTKGKDTIIFGIIGLAVIVGMWGLVTIVTNTFFSPGSGVAPSSDQLNNLLPH